MWASLRLHLLLLFAAAVSVTAQIELLSQDDRVLDSTPITTPHSSRGLLTWVPPPALPPEALPELQQLKPVCAVSSARESCPRTYNISDNWYSTSVIGEVAGCGYSWEEATPGLKILGGEGVYYFNKTAEIFDIGARVGAEFTYIYSLQRRCKYRVCMAFRETYYTTNGARVFDVFANNKPVLTHFDIFAITSKRLSPKVYCFEPELLTPWLSLHFRTSKYPGSYASVSEINVCELDCSAAYRATLPPIDPPFPPFDPARCRLRPRPPPCTHTTCCDAYPIAQINVGGQATCGFTADAQVPRPCEFTAEGGVSDKCHPSRAKVAVVGGDVRDVLGSALDVTRSWRWGKSFKYTWTNVVDRAPHFLRLVFSEQLWSGPYTRIMNVLLDGKVIIAGLDVAGVAGGGDTPYIFELFFNSSASCTINLEFQGFISNAMVSAIEIYNLQGSPVRLRPPSPPRPAPLPPPAPVIKIYNNNWDWRRLQQDTPHECTDSPYGSPDDLQYEDWGTRTCPSLVPESEARRGLGAFRALNCKNGNQDIRPGVWKIADPLAWPCCRQCRWAQPDGESLLLGRAMLGDDLPICPQCVVDYYMNAYPAVQDRANLVFYDQVSTSARCTSPNDPDGVTWLYRPSQGPGPGTCYMRSNKAVRGRLAADSRSSGAFYPGRDFCTSLGASMLIVQDSAEEAFIQQNLLFQNGAGGSALVGAIQQPGLVRFRYGVPPGYVVQFAPSTGQEWQFDPKAIQPPTRSALCLQWHPYQDPTPYDGDATKLHLKSWSVQACSETTFICEKPARVLANDPTGIFGDAA